MLDILPSFIIFCFGLAVGSFLNVVIIRGQKSERLTGRSHCVHCNTTLSWSELIPMASFLIQRTRCRHCKQRISWQYPLVELACAVGYLAAFQSFLSSGYPTNLDIAGFLGFLVGVPAVIVIMVSDLKYQTIPDGATFTLGVLGLVAVVGRAFFWPASPVFAVRAGNALPIWYDLGIAFVLSGVLGSLWLFSRGKWMGFGDVKLILATSLILGFPAAIPAFLFAFWSGGIAGGILLLAGAKKLNQRIPFGPFILLGALIAWFFSPLFFNQIGLGILM